MSKCVVCFLDVNWSSFPTGCLLKIVFFSNILEYILDPGLKYVLYDEPPEGRIVNHNTLRKSTLIK